MQIATCFGPYWPIIGGGRGTQLYKTIVQPFCLSQFVELSQVRQFMSIEMDMCRVVGAACRFKCIQGTD
jgi:hypothetical protein